MPHPRFRKYISTFERRTFTRFLAVAALATASVLALAPGSTLAKSSHSRSVGDGRGERSNSRISVRPQTAPARRTLTTNLAVPFFGSIDVDRTDDDAGASACTATLN